MATENVAQAADAAPASRASLTLYRQKPANIVNDFSIQIATVNGSGSQSANSGPA